VVVMQLRVGLTKNVEEWVHFAPEGGKVVVKASPRVRDHSSGVDLRVALQALEVRLTNRV
jgi:protein transport protein DSL1/ZW10